MISYEFKLITYPNILLTTILPEYKFDQDIDPDIIMQNMHRLIDQYNGMGISANQINYNRRVITITYNDQKLTMFNPQIVDQTIEETPDIEGCLSFPNLFLPIKRCNKLTVSYLTNKAEPYTIELSNYDAKCFLHELDHINGICFTSKVSKLKLDLALRKMRKNYGRTK